MTGWPGAAGARPRDAATADRGRPRTSRRPPPMRACGHPRDAAGVTPERAGGWTDRGGTRPPRPASSAGSNTVNTDPSPSTLVASRRPPARSTRRFTMDSPSPLPSSSRVSSRFSRKNSSQSRARFSSLMPMPVSATSSRSQPSSTTPRTVTVPRSRLYLTALPTRLLSTSCRSSGRMSAGGRPAASSVVTVTPRCTPRSRASSTISSRMGATGTSSGSSPSGACSLRARVSRSRISSTRLSMRWSARRDHRQVGVEVVAEALVGDHLEQPLDGPERALQLVHHGADEPLLLHREAPDLTDVAQREDAARAPRRPHRGRSRCSPCTPGRPGRAGGPCGPWPARPAARRAAPGRRRRAAPAPAA